MVFRELVQAAWGRLSHFGVESALADYKKACEHLDAIEFASLKRQS